MTKYQVLDISGWERLRLGKGTSETYWVVNPKNRQRALFKVPRYNEDKDFYAGGHWAEKIASEIGNKLDVPTANVDLVVCNGILGCVSYSFLLKEQRLTEAINVLDLDVTMKNRINYNFENIYNKLSEYKNEIKNRFIEMLLFDAFIGQQDRHEENWGLIINKKEKRIKFAPLYDNASCLGRELLPKGVEKRLKDDMCFEAYIKSKARAKIRLNPKENPTHIEILYYLLENHKGVYGSFAERLKNLKTSDIKEIVNKVPDNFMNKSNKQLAIKILLVRKNIFLNIVEGIGVE